MITRDKVSEIVFLSIAQTADLFGLKNEFDLESKLLDDYIDSIMLVHLLVTIESKLFIENININITDDNAISQEKSPFKTIGSLIDFIYSQANE